MKVAINESTLTAIGDAIREKTETTDLIAPGDMPNKIRSITTGEGYDGYIIFDNQTGEYMFGEGAWDNFIEQYGDKVLVSNMTNANFMFYDAGVTSIPFTIGIRGNELFSMFREADKLVSLPNIEITTDKTTLDISTMFYDCSALQEVDLSFIPDNITEVAYPSGLFRNCSSLRNIYGLEKIKNNTYSNRSYDDMFRWCESLDRITGLYPTEYEITTNVFSNTFTGCGRVDSITFLMDGTTPYTRSWRNQTLDLSSAGYVTSETSDLDPFPISVDKRVTNGTKYDALKYDPDWWSSDPKYSRYTKTSALATINSLPTCSTAGSNIIKFKGEAGLYTDGGAINTMTSTQIAAAAAKGWTVALA